MKFWKTIDIADNEKALIFRRSRLESVLSSGRHHVWGFGNSVQVSVYDISSVDFSHARAKFLTATQSDKLSEHVNTYELTDTEIGLYYRDGHLVDVLAPGSFKAVWKGVENIVMDIVDISSNYIVDERILGLIGRGSNTGKIRTIAQSVSYVEVPDEHVGLLIVNGKFKKLLDTGSYGYWKYNRSISVKLVDLRLQSVDVSGQEILTKDRVSLRMNLSASYRIALPETIALKINDYSGFIYRELQLKLREAVGTKTLDELLEDKDSLNVVVFEAIQEILSEYGVEIKSVGVKDIILPGDMKTILNKVVEAQKEAEANLIKRREETQAVRSLHNTAKMMENNTILLRLKELESLERIADRIDKISVYGGLDGVMNGLVKLSPS